MSQVNYGRRSNGSSKAPAVVQRRNQRDSSFKPRVEIPKQYSGVRTVPLLKQTCSAEAFTVYEQAWINYAMSQYCMDGKCFDKG